MRADSRLQTGAKPPGRHTWELVPEVVDALDAAFYAAFSNVEPTGKRWVLGIDVSASTDWGQVAKGPGLIPRVKAAAMALVIAATEQQHSSSASVTSWCG